MFWRINLVVLICYFLHRGNCITNNYRKNNGYMRDPLNLIWNLTSYAVQSRQLGNENNYFPNGNDPIIPFGNAQNVLDAMFSIAQNDDHLCVPKLLCDITSGTISYGRQSFLPGFNMDSLIGVLSNFEAVSPIVLFGRAALLGYNSKGDSYSCSRAYPKCPSNPDLLLNYLNNHNGGFFRFFNGVPDQQMVETPGIVGFDGEHYGFVAKRREHFAQKRILNENKRQNGYFKFPLEEMGYYRDGRKLVFPHNEDNDNFLDIQKPLPNHVPSPTIFPVRTGTGSLIIEDFEDKEYYNKDKGFIKFV